MAEMTCGDAAYRVYAGQYPAVDITVHGADPAEVL
jgi:hypothetical protein